MKFILFILIIGYSCFLAATLNDNLPTSPLNIPLESSENGVDMERLNSHWPNFSNIMAKTLLSWNKLQCIAKEILKMNEASLKFMSDIKKCSSDSTKTDDALDTNDITENDGKVAVSIDSLEITKVLYYDSHNNDNNMDLKTSPKLFSELYGKKIALKDGIDDGVRIETACKAGICAFKATKEWQKVLMEFYNIIGKCLSE